MNNYYVYIYYRLDTNEPFYVGMGHGDRWKRTDMTARGHNKHFMNIINKIPIAVVIIKDNLTEEQALGIEYWTINELVFEYGFSIEIKGNNSNNHYCHLTNMTWGGKGGSGRDMSGENNPMYGRDWREGKTEEELKEHSRNLSISLKGKMKGEKHPNFGKHGKDVHNSMPIVCLNTKEFFYSIKDASNCYKIDNSGIARCCKGKTKFSGKSFDGIPLVWRYYEDYINMTEEDIRISIENAKNWTISKETREKISKKNSGKNNPNAKSIICITTNKIFYTSKEAQNYYHCDNSSILKCCKGKIKSAGKLPDGTKLVWRYIIWNHNKIYKIKEMVR